MTVHPSIRGPRRTKQPPAARITELQARQITRQDPAPNQDGSCLICRKQRNPERSKNYAGVTAQLDPFCSCECARVWYRNPVPDRSVCSIYGDTAA